MPNPKSRTAVPAAEQSNEVAGARWAFIEALRRKSPSFFERLRKDVYPRFAELAAGSADYWASGWTFATWQLYSDRDEQLTPILLAWARSFNVDGELWLLEGALETL